VELRLQQLNLVLLLAGPSSPTAAGLWPLAGHPLPSGQLVGNPTRQTLCPASARITVNLGAQSQAAFMLQNTLSRPCPLQVQASQ